MRAESGGRIGWTGHGVGTVLLGEVALPRCPGRGAGRSTTVAADRDNGPMAPQTPYLRVDEARLQANIDRVAGWAAASGFALRPHAKTHKVPEIARRQLAAGAVGLTVATIGEAEVFADGGASDLFIGYPLWLTAASGRRLAALTERAAVSIGVDSAEGARQAATALAGAPVAVLVEVDCGHRRSGVPPEGVRRVAEAAARAGLAVAGVFSFPGHSYGPGAAARAAADEARALAQAAEALAGLTDGAPVISGGSSPSLAASDGGVLTEVRPGVYVFGDSQQWELGACAPEDIALTCHATVISARPGRFVVDAGSKILGADRAAWATGFGRLLDDPEARIVLLSEHHAVIESPSPTPMLGSVVRLVPNHVCNAVNLVDELWHTPTDFWPVAARGRNS